MSDDKARIAELEAALAQAAQYGPKWWPADKEIEDGWEETEFYTNDYQYVLIFVVPPQPAATGGEGRE